MTIGELAQRAGLATSAVRFYERAGLLPPAERVSGQRRYREETVRRLEVIATAKQAGFTLDEIRILLDSTDRGTPSSQPLRELAAQKLPEVEALIERAQRMEAWLEHASRCTCTDLDECGLFTR